MAEFTELWATLSLWASWLWGQWQTQWIVAHVLANVVVAVAVSIYTKEFILSKTGEFLYRKLLPMLATYAAFAFAGDTINQAGVATMAWAAIEAMLLGDLLDNFRKLGLPIPDGLTKARL